MSDAGNDDSEDSSSNFQRTALDEFREKWQQELKIDDKIKTKTNENEKEEEEDVKNLDENKAKLLFLEGIEYEKKGKVFDAIKFYRRAIQIVPDIEFRIYETTKNIKKIDEKNVELLHKNENENITNNDNELNEENLDGVDLIIRFNKTNLGRLIQKANDSKNVIITGAHFADLPTEIIFFILKWVVSSDLDMRSLEYCSMVSKGFYLCARDSEIWRQACVKVWGVNIGQLKASPYNSWRQMFINRTRVLYNGCYISKTNYIRLGENSFQDQFYRPVQLIEYYRYIRFFPDGQILMMTTSDDPQQSVGKLRKNSTRNDILKGHYRLLNNDIVSIALKRIKTATLTNNYHYNRGRRGSIIDQDNCYHTFYLEMSIASTAKRKFSQLQWKHYSIIQTKNKHETTTDFELTTNRYPPLRFSTVKSYHAESECPLQC